MNVFEVVGRLLREGRCSALIAIVLVLYCIGAGFLRVLGGPYITRPLDATVSGVHAQVYLACNQGPGSAEDVNLVFRFPEPVNWKELYAETCAALRLYGEEEQGKALRYVPTAAGCRMPEGSQFTVAFLDFSGKNNVPRDQQNVRITSSQGESQLSPGLPRTTLVMLRLRQYLAPGLLLLALGMSVVIEIGMREKPKPSVAPAQQDILELSLALLRGATFTAPPAASDAYAVHEPDVRWALLNILKELGPRQQ